MTPPRLLLLLLAAAAASPALPSCGEHPCGWVHYSFQQGRWSASGIQPNTFCRCGEAQSCRHSATQTAVSASVTHVFRCREGGGGGTFPGTIALRRRIPWSSQQDRVS